MKSRLTEKALQHESRIAKLREIEAARRQKVELQQAAKDHARQAEWERGRERRKRDGYGFVRMAIYLRQQDRKSERSKRDRDIRAVYWSEVRPRHFRRAIPSSFVHLLQRKQRDFYPIGKLFREPGISSS